MVGFAGSAAFVCKALVVVVLAGGCAANKPPLLGAGGLVVSGCFKNPVSAGLG